MNRSVVTKVSGVLIVLVALAWASAALAADCQFHRFRGGFAVMDEPLGDYDVCYTSRVRGTINGRLISCYYGADFYASGDLWGDGNYVYFAGRGDDFLETQRGDIQLVERAMFDLTSNLATGQAELVGGTGDFEGATGVLQFYNKYPNRLDLFVYEGRICLPDE